MSTDHAAQHATKRAAVKQQLMDGLWHDHAEIAEVGGNRYGARLHELKEEGYSIESRKLAKGKDGKEYRLLSSQPGAPVGKRVKALLLEADVDYILCLLIPPTARIALLAALASYRENKGKL